MNKSSLKEKFSVIQEHWQPKVIAELNQLNISKLKVMEPGKVYEW